MANQKSIFETLSKIDVNDKKKEKNRLSYLPWTWAWSMVKEIYPEATYEIHMTDGKPYLYDENLGYLVMTSVTIKDETLTMWLPVMDGANKAMKSAEYTYKVKEYKQGRFTGNYIDKSVAPATMFDINTAIMRCLVKNLAMFGLGHYIYAGESLPPEDTIPRGTNANPTAPPAPPKKKEQPKKEEKNEPESPETISVSEEGQVQIGFEKKKAKKSDNATDDPEKLQRINNFVFTHKDKDVNLVLKSIKAKYTLTDVDVDAIVEYHKSLKDG